MPLYYRFFHILFVDSDNDKFVTNVEVRPSTHRRQEQPRAAFEVRQPPAHRILHIFRVQHSCTRLTRKPCTPAPHLHRNASSSSRDSSAASAVIRCAVRAAACTKHCRRPHAARRSFGRRWSSWTFWIPSRRNLDADAINFCSTCRFCFPISGERCALWLRRDGRHVPRCAACTFLRG